MGKKLGESLENTIPQPSKQERDYETEGNLDALHRAADIMSNPSKLKKVHKMAGRRHKAVMGMIEPQLKGPKPIKSIDDLKAVSNKIRSGTSTDADDDTDE